MRKIVISSESRDTYAQQLAAALRSGIRDKTYRAGSLLPPMAEIAAAAGVSLNVVRHALAELKAEGLVMPRRRAGTQVVAGGVANLRGRILILIKDMQFGFYWSTLLKVVQTKLTAFGYEVAVLALPVRSNWTLDSAPLKKLRPGAYDLALTNLDNDVIASALDAVRLPYVTVGLEAQTGVGSRGFVSIQQGEAFAAFLSDCARKRPAEIMHVCKGYQARERDLTPSLGNLGIRLSRLPVRRISHDLLPSVIEESALVTMKRYLSGGKKLPDLLLALDDYIAAGMLTALLAAGIRIPEDVRLVAFSVRGHGPILGKPVTRIELDPLAHADTLVSGIRSVMAGHALPSDCILRANYIRGETF